MDCLFFFLTVFFVYNANSQYLNIQTFNTSDFLCTTPPLMYEFYSRKTNLACMYRKSEDKYYRYSCDGENLQEEQCNEECASCVAFEVPVRVDCQIYDEYPVTISCSSSPVNPNSTPRGSVIVVNYQHDWNCLNDASDPITAYSHEYYHSTNKTDGLAFACDSENNLTYTMCNFHSETCFPQNKAAFNGDKFNSPCYWNGIANQGSISVFCSSGDVNDRFGIGTTWDSDVSAAPWRVISAIYIVVSISFLFVIIRFKANLMFDDPNIV